MAFLKKLKTKERRMTCTEPKNITNDGNVGYTLITLNILTLFVAFLPRLFLLTEPSFDHMTCTLTFGNVIRHLILIKHNDYDFKTMWRKLIQMLI
ncbi:hypothetical protein KSF78_0008429 [Schistosoma japonicum]|nr:hypothetical protein KSF78_0008429 [Schistosoma japonicum]